MELQSMPLFCLFNCSISSELILQTLASDFEDNGYQTIKLVSKPTTHHFCILLKPWCSEESNVHLLEVNAADIMIIILIHSHHFNITLVIALNGSTEINMKSLVSTM